MHAATKIIRIKIELIISSIIIFRMMMMIMRIRRRIVIWMD